MRNLNYKKKSLRNVLIILFLQMSLISNIYADNKKTKNVNNDNVSNKNRIYSNLKKFSNIYISGFAKVIIEYGKTHSLKIETKNEKLLKQIDVFSNNNTLSIITDIRNFNNHKVITYSIKSKAKNKFNTQKLEKYSILSFIQTKKGNYLIQDNKLYSIDTVNLQELITIYITTPDIENLTINGNLDVIIKKAKNEKFENEQKAEELIHSDIKINNKKNLSIYACCKAKVKIVDLYLNNFNVKLSEYASLNADNLETKSILLKSKGLSKINIGNISNKDNATIEVSESSTLNVNSKIKSKNINIRLKNKGLLKFKKTILDDKIDLNIDNNSSLTIANLKSENLSVKISENANLNINGGKIIPFAEFDLSGNPIVNMSKIPILNAKINASGIGKIHLNLPKILTINIPKRGFTLKYEGKPKIIDLNRKKIQKKKKNKVSKKKNRKK